MPYPGLVERTLRCRSGTFERTVWSLAPPVGRPTAAVLFLDAELYLERVGAAAVVRRLLERRAIPPPVAVFLSAGGAAARHEDFVCRPEYARFVARDLVGSVQEEHPGATEIVIAGLSLSGLAAAYAATRHPAVFRAAVCQSPSCWWERGRFAEELPAATPAGPEFWICVGSRETEAGLSHPPSGLRQGLTQVGSCVSAAAALRAKGYGVRYREYDGGHDPGCGVGVTTCHWPCPGYGDEGDHPRMSAGRLGLDREGLVDGVGLCPSSLQASASRAKVLPSGS